MLMFLVLMIYLVECLTLTRIATSLGKKWKQYVHSTEHCRGGDADTCAGT